jgi:hypothetical protein
MKDFTCGRCGVLNKADGTSGCICGRFKTALETVQSPWFFPLACIAVLLGVIVSIWYEWWTPILYNKGRLK